MSALAGAAGEDELKKFGNVRSGSCSAAKQQEITLGDSVVQSVCDWKLKVRLDDFFVFHIREILAELCIPMGINSR